MNAPRLCTNVNGSELRLTRENKRLWLLLLLNNVSNSSAHENKYPGLPPRRFFLHFVEFLCLKSKIGPFTFGYSHIIFKLHKQMRLKKKKVKQIGVFHPWGVEVHNKQWKYAALDFSQILLRAAWLVSDTCGMNPRTDRSAGLGILQLHHGAATIQYLKQLVVSKSYLAPLSCLNLPAVWKLRGRCQRSWRKSVLRLTFDPDQ